MDPLSVLREFASEQKLDQVVVDGTRIEYVLPSLSFNRIRISAAAYCLMAIISVHIKIHSSMGI